MAVNVVIPLLIPLEENIYNATRLLSETISAVQFSEPRYCLLVAEDAPTSLPILQVAVTHTGGEPVRYSISGGNRDGLFTIDQNSGIITLAAVLDYEARNKHELVVTAETGKANVQSVVQVNVADINDNPPEFLENDFHVTVLEEDHSHLPATILKVEAVDADRIDTDGLAYSIMGDGVHAGKSIDKFFAMTSEGELIQLRALNRDPPSGQDSWQLKVQVRDGQRILSNIRRSKRRHVRLSKQYSGDSISYQTESSAIHPVEFHTYSDCDLPQNIHLEKCGYPSRGMKEVNKNSREIALNVTPRVIGKSVAYQWKAIKTDVLPLPGKLARSKIKRLDTRRRFDLPLLKRGIEGRIKKNNAKWRKNIYSSERKSSSHDLKQVISSKNNELDFPEIPCNSSRTQESLKGCIVLRPSSRSKFRKRRIRFLSRKQNHRFFKRPTTSSLNDSIFHDYQLSGNVHDDEEGYIRHYNSSKASMIKKRISVRQNIISRIHRRHQRRRRLRKSPDIIDSENVAYQTDFSESHFVVDNRYVKNFLSEDGGCQDYILSSLSSYEDLQGVPEFLEGVSLRTSFSGFGHMAEVRVNVLVKDVNDNPPVFPNETIYGDVQENGPIDLTVGVVSAWDADDASDGSNALVTYSIDKNVVDERSGQAIFAIHPDTGLIRTTVCCLDRETTPEYHIQVVAVDGGGLKATSTVMVRLVDVNDNSPRLTRDSYEVSVNETWGLGPQSQESFLKVTTLDRDTSNYFLYRVVEGSGWGWEHFGVRTIDNKGELYGIQTLDFEDPTHRKGFRFLIQVTDRGRGGWSDPRHTHSAWVKVHLLDLNDNPPEFQRQNAHITVREDTTPGSLLVTMPAIDKDMNGQQSVKYFIQDNWNALKINSVGGITLWRALDREMEGGEIGVAKVIAIDEGRPALTSTASLTITVTDVNDTPPRLLPSTIFHLVEEAPPTRLGFLTATDDDVWTLGHGPPFNVSLSPSNLPHVLERIALIFDSGADSGRGGGELWSLKPVDREEFAQLTAEVLVSDAGGVSTTYPVNIIIDDLNDNPMKPAGKTVYLWKAQGGNSDTSIGRIYVEDPDDWDLKDKTFSWSGPPHPLFTLQPQNGDIFASTKVRAERYELSFSVSDRVWKQEDVRANVTVLVKYLTAEALTHSVPITLSPTTPSAITAGWSPKEGGGGLGILVAAVSKAVNMPEGGSVEVVSVFGNTSSRTWRDRPYFSTSYYGPIARDRRETFTSSASDLDVSQSPFACVWVCVMEEVGGAFMNPVKLQGLLSLSVPELERSMKLKVSLKEPRLEAALKPLEWQDFSSIYPKDNFSPSEDLTHFHSHHPSYVASLASKTLPLQVVDNNRTSLVTPRLTKALGCHRYVHQHHHPDAHRSPFDTSCTPTSCLNGGRCVRTDTRSKCICPGGSWGRQCKILSRSFRGEGWAWLDPLPQCLPLTLSFEVLTSHADGLLLYSGPLTSALDYSEYPAIPALYVQVFKGHPQVVLQGGQVPHVLTVNSRVDNGKWHKLYIHFSKKGIALVIDSCGKGWMEGATNDTHCFGKLNWENSKLSALWESNTPLQLGGMAHRWPHPWRNNWPIHPVKDNFKGCISNLKVNRQLIDLGEPAYSSHSEAGCIFQKEACASECGWNGKCMGYLTEPSCICDPGWTGPECGTTTVPSLFRQGSYTKIALSFTPDPYYITTQLRMKTMGSPSGVLIELASHHRSEKLTVLLHDGLACASVTGINLKNPWMDGQLCFKGYHLGDGAWHTIMVERQGNSLMITVDDGDDLLYNDTLESFIENAGNLQEILLKPPDPLFVDKQDGITVGGLPEYMGVNSVTVHEDLNDICIDDLRVSGHPLPLPPTVNGTSWGQVTTFQQVESGCQSPDGCINTTCLPPLTCHSSWPFATCSCGPGRYLVNGKCQDVDECIYQPCLHGGTCYNLIPGYQCTCNPEHAGDNCQWDNLPDYTHRLTGPIVLAALTLTLFVIVVFVVVFTIQIHRWHSTRRPQPSNSTDVEMVAETSLTTENPCLETLERSCPAMLHQTESGIKDISTTELSFHIIVPLGMSQRLQVTSQDDCFSEQSSKYIPLQGSSKITELTSILPAQDDLRAYAYEGDGSSSDSFTSALAGLCSDTVDVGSTKIREPVERKIKDIMSSKSTIEAYGLYASDINHSFSVSSQLSSGALKENKSSIGPDKSVKC